MGNCEHILINGDIFVPKQQLDYKLAQVFSVCVCVFGLLTQQRTWPQCQPIEALNAALTSG